MSLSSGPYKASPAHAGMNRVLRPGEPDRPGLSRARGDEPLDEATSEYLATPSPADAGMNGCGGAAVRRCGGAAVRNPVVFFFFPASAEITHTGVPP